MTSAPSDRTRVRRLPERARYGRADVLAILREGLVAHVGLVDESRGPLVVPMVYGVDDDYLYLHGAPASRLMRALAAGAPCCVEVTLLDALVIARTVFHHSMNYRSVMVHGSAEPVQAAAAKNEALRVIVEHVVPGQWGVARVPSSEELAGTAVVRLSLAEAAAKVRAGDPVDEDKDMGLPIWAGLIPIERRFGGALDAQDLGPGLTSPDHLDAYRR